MHKTLRLSAFVVMLFCVSGFTECYKPVTKNQLPSRIRTVAVPAFENSALRFKIESRVTKAVMDELIHRGRGLRVQGDREGADAVIEGVIKSFNFAGVLLDDKGRARIFEVTIVAAVTVRDQAENRVLYDNQNFVFRGEFEFANDPRNFFSEEDPAVQRMARSLAESIVSTLINAVETEKEMSALSRNELERSLKEGRLAPVYLLVGCEGYLRDNGARTITDAALSDTLLREFNESSFSLTSGGAQEAIAAANQLPMMSTRRVVKVSDFGKLREADEEALVRYISNPAGSTVMIFSAEDIDKRKKLARTLLEKCQVVDYPALKDGEARTWVKSRLKELKATCDEQALTEIIMLVGTDVQTLCSELDKLTSAALPTRRITIEMVDDLIARSRELSNWDLGDHLVARNRKQALETLYRLLEGGSQPVMLLGAIAGNYHRLALAKEALTRGSRDDVFRVVPLPSFKRDAFINNLKRSDAAKIAHGIELIAAADLAIKTSVGGGGPKGARLQLEMLVCELSG